MHIVIGIIVIIIVGLGMQIFDAIGGWPGVVLILGGLIGGGFAIWVSLERNKAIKAINAMPREVDTLMANARALSSADLATHLRAMEAEFAAGRATVFWDKFDEAANHLADIDDTLKRAHELARAHNEGVAQYRLSLKQITVEDGDEQFIADGLRDALIQVRDAALTNTGFALVYEQRRQSQEIRDEVAAVRETASAALEASLDASDAARHARRAAKRASGDWF